MENEHEKIIREKKTLTNNEKSGYDYKCTVCGYNLFYFEDDEDGNCICGYHGSIEDYVSPEEKFYKNNYFEDVNFEGAYEMFLPSMSIDELVKY